MGRLGGRRGGPAAWAKKTPDERLQFAEASRGRQRRWVERTTHAERSQQILRGWATRRSRHTMALTSELLTLSDDELAVRLLRDGIAVRVRETAGLTQAQLGARIGVNGVTINRWERGTTR